MLVVMWKRDSSPTRPRKAVPTIAFRVLDAPLLKDDYYCSVLAYSVIGRTLAVALSQKVYLWTENYGVRYPPLPAARPGNHVSSMAFSSEEGGKAILAIARHGGSVQLWSLFEPRQRFEVMHSKPACCVAFRPITWPRRLLLTNEIILCEDLLVGDDAGQIYYYSVDWPRHGPGSMVLLIRLDAHAQNICGLTWSPDGMQFVSGGNDNCALLYETEKVLRMAKGNSTYGEDVFSPHERSATPVCSILTPETSPIRGLDKVLSDEAESSTLSPTTASLIDFAFNPYPQNLGWSTTDTHDHARHGRASERILQQGTRIVTPQSSPGASNHLPRSVWADPTVSGLADCQTYTFYHAAAVKALAFPKWQARLLATGGGSNDRQIHFHHTGSGTTLAVINVFAQVTSLV